MGGAVRSLRSTTKRTWPYAVPFLEIPHKVADVIEAAKEGYLLDGQKCSF